MQHIVQDQSGTEASQGLDENDVKVRRLKVIEVSATRISQLRNDDASNVRCCLSKTKLARLVKMIENDDYTRLSLTGQPLINGEILLPRTGPSLRPSAANLVILFT
jgi:hypothetical protein